MSETKRIIDLCTDCDACVKNCLFLEKYCNSPKELAIRFKRNPKENTEIPYSCDLCDLCEKVCPEGLNPALMFYETRKEIIKSDGEELSEDFIYRHIIPKHRAIRNHQYFSTSWLFKMTKASGEGKTKRIFFPGCSLPAYSPYLVLKTLKYLKEKLPDTGIILNCCGKPTWELGEQKKFESILNGVASDLKRIGAEEIIVACPNCYNVFIKFLKEFKIRILYEVMIEHGIPSPPSKGRKGEVKGGQEEIAVTVHDSCHVRYNHSIQDAVREIVRAAGYNIFEMKHRREVTACCGAGGCANYGNTALADLRTKERAEEARGHDMISYCAHCRERFSPYAPSLHVLDLLFMREYHKRRLKIFSGSWLNWLKRGYLKIRLKIGI